MAVIHILLGLFGLLVTTWGISWKQISVAGIPTYKFVGVAVSQSGQHMSTLQFNDYGGGYILYSHDFGDHWNISSGTPVIGWRSIAIDSSGQYLVVCSDKTIYRSDDFGKNFSPIVQQLPCKRLTMSADGKYLTAIMSRQVYVSQDYGVTWTLTLDIQLDNFMSLAASSDGKRVFTGVPYTGMYISNDYGVTWETGQIPDQDTHISWNGVASDAAGVNLIGISYSKVYYSSNSGYNWTLSTAVPEYSWQSVSMSGDGSYAVISDNFRYVHYSSDMGVTWDKEPTLIGSVHQVSINSDATFALSGMDYISRGTVAV